MRVFSAIVLLVLSGALVATTTATYFARQQETVQWIAFARSEEFVRRCINTPAQIMRGVPGSDEMQPIISNLGMVIRLSFSPDGSRLVYDTSDATRTVQPHPNGGTTSVCNHSLHIHNLDTNRSTPLDIPLEDAFAPAWSPDGEWIAFVGRERVTVEGLNGTLQLVDEFAVYKVRPDGSDFIKLAPSTRLGRVSWSPDGQRITYAGGVYGSEDVFVVAADGESLPQRLTFNDSSDLTPVFDPTGEYIAFLSDRFSPQHEHDVFMMRADGTLPRQIEDTPHFSGAFTFYDDTDSLIFVQDVLNARFYLMQADVADVEGMNRSANGSFVETETREVEVINPDGTTSTITQLSTRVRQLPTPQQVSPDDSANYWAPTLAPEVKKVGALWPGALLAVMMLSGAVWLLWWRPRPRAQSTSVRMWQRSQDGVSKDHQRSVRSVIQHAVVKPTMRRGGRMQPQTK
jgi:hypothetical protein